MSKPIVHFRGTPEFLQAWSENGRTDLLYARVDALDHPFLGEAIVRTSVLVSEANPDKFETKNSIYQRKEGA